MHFKFGYNYLWKYIMNYNNKHYDYLYNALCKTSSNVLLIWIMGLKSLWNFIGWVTFQERNFCYLKLKPCNKKNIYILFQLVTKVTFSFSLSWCTKLTKTKNERNLLRQKLIKITKTQQKCSLPYVLHFFDAMSCVINCFWKNDKKQWKSSAVVCVNCAEVIV